MVFAVIVLFISFIVLWLLTMAQYFNFEERVIKIAVREDADTRLFTLLATTRNRYPYENLIGYSIASNREILKKPIEMNLTKGLADKLNQIQSVVPNYNFSVRFDGKGYLNVISDPTATIPPNSPIASYLMAMPYHPNPRNLTAEAILVTWK